MSDVPRITVSVEFRGETVQQEGAFFTVATCSGGRRSLTRSPAVGLWAWPASSSATAMSAAR